MVNDRTTKRTKAWPVPIFASLLCLLLAACGGSGSSGFDGDAASEPEAITRALDEDTCVAFQDVTYCASGAATDVGGESVSLGFDTTEPLVCADVPDNAVCVASTSFTPAGFPEVTQYLSAWSETIDGPWVLAATTPAGEAPGSDPDEREVQAVLPEPSPGMPSSPVVFAVLVYPDEVPSDLPAVADELAGFGSELVYVSSELEVETSAPAAPLLSEP